MSEQISYTTIKKHRSGARLWLEGAKLQTAGFERGGYYFREIDTENKTITLKEHPDGDYKVSGRLRNDVELPIIDLSLGKFGNEFPEGTRIRAIFCSRGVIKITIHHEEQAKTTREERLKKAILSGKLTEASVCTGGGISTAAVHQAITENDLDSSVVWVVDQEIKYLQSAAAQNFAITDETVFFESKLEELEPELLKQVDIFSFSLPCAGLSQAGASSHKLSPEEHESGTSIFGLMSTLRAANPSIIYSENVPQAKGSPMYVLIQQELIRRGYHVIEAVLDNVQTGTFENRKRFWFMAISNGLPVSVVNEVFKFKMTRTYPTLRDLLDVNVSESDWSANEYLKAKSIRDAKNGKGFAKRQLLNGDETHCGTIGRFYHKRRSTEPFIVRGDGMERLLTINEHARAKSIPETLIAKCNMTHGHEILGQSVDYRQAFAPMFNLIHNLKNYFKGDDLIYYF